VLADLLRVRAKGPLSGGAALKASALVDACQTQREQMDLLAAVIADVDHPRPVVQHLLAHCERNPERLPELARAVAEIAPALKDWTGR
jgi:hypothetical protein